MMHWRNINGPLLLNVTPLAYAASTKDVWTEEENVHELIHRSANPFPSLQDIAMDHNFKNVRGTKSFIRIRKC